MKLVPTEFDMERSFPVPREIARHQLLETNLLIAPKIPAWIVVADHEAEAILRLSRGASLREAAYSLNSWGISNANEALSTLLTKLAVNDFIEPDTTIEVEDEVTLQIHVTNACNLRCKHCYVSSGEPFSLEIGVDAWIDVIEEARNRYNTVYLSISGGEPLLVPWLPELLQHSKSLGIRTSILSNGMLWTDKRIAEIGSYVDLVNVSLDGASDTVHDAVRGNGAFRQAIRGIRRLGEAGIEVGINICLMKSNIADIEANFHNLIQSLPFKVSVLFAKFVEEGRGLENRNEAVAPDAMARLLPKLSMQFLGTGWQPTSPTKRISCGFGKLYALYANGDVSPCLSPRYIAGNIVAEPVGKVFDRIMLNAKRANVEKLPLCKSCDLRYICGGKCHLPQVTTGIPIHQNDCSSKFRNDYYQRLVERGQKENGIMLPLFSRVI
ncbi:radical SAM protein [Paucibacter sp. APW11]|uniref:Radical SAM protein n=1 Tax=Roseateles aquae TaxID=3077235 RepID=A0ABU3PFG7_9BURK|nr:radical SAM protein [Paucibacter sp. APW11]MDT9000907.1 radical SAM protein [Paucibacter sp. APW11]